MDFDDSEQSMVTLKREKVRGLTHPEIVARLESEAASAGLEPMDRNWSGKPNVYLRGIYQREADCEPRADDECLSDLFVMFVQPRGSSR